MATQLPEWRKGLAVLVHEMQLELDAPLHVPHDASQAWQLLLASAYIPAGVHDARHELVEASKNGCAVAQDVHSVDAGPVQVAHETSHATHVSLEMTLPPEQVNPSSMAAQFASQPSRLRRLPSSHASAPTRRPSPQIGMHESRLETLPPLQVNPTSMVPQSALQPSPETVLLSSQTSLAHLIRRPSPQTTVHVSRPPTP